MQAAPTTRPLPYISERAAELLDEVRAFRARKIPVESIRLMMGGRRGELADTASLVFYCKGKYKYLYLQHPDDELRLEPGRFVIHVESATRRIEQMWLINELEKRLPIRYPQTYVVGGDHHESYHGESTEFEYKELVSALKEMANKEFLEEVPPPEPRHHATKAALREEILELLDLTEAQAESEEYEDYELYLEAELDEDESDVEDDSYEYHQFKLHVDDDIIEIDEDTYEELSMSGTWSGELRGDNFYAISLGKVMLALE